jgi:hypothetical protein
MKYPSVAQLQRETHSQLVGNPRRRDKNPSPTDNASGNWEVVSTDGGLEGIFAREDDATMYADEIRSSGARGVKIQRRRVQLRSQAARRAGNPSMTADDAVNEFRNLLRDPDPAAMLIAEDIALEHKLSLADLSSSGTPTSGHFSLGPLHPADAPVYRVEWTVEPRYAQGWPQSPARTMSPTKPHFAIGLRYVWNNVDKDLLVPSGHGRYMTTQLGARRAAAADAWAVAKRMKELMAEGRTDEDPSPKFTTQPSTIHQELESAMHAIDPTAPELYEHRSTRRGKQPTYLEARDDIMGALNRSGWRLSPAGLRLPHATSNNGVLRLWFKPQAVHYTTSASGRHEPGNARSISYDLDIRKITPTEFIDQVRRKFPGGFE